MSFEPENKKIALVHGYWPSQKDNGLYHQGLRGQIITRLSAHAFHRGLVDTLVADNGPVWGDGYKPPGQLMADDWENLYGIPKSRIVCRPEAVSTFDENRIFLEERDKYGWTDLTDIAFGKHHWVIPHYYPEGTNVTYLSAEKLAQTVGDVEVQEWMRRLRFSRYELTYAVYLSIQKAVLLGGQAELLRHMGSATRTGKRREFILPTDKFDL